MNRLHLRGLIAGAALMAACLGGCGPEEKPKTEEAKYSLIPVAEAERDWARERLRAVWDVVDPIVRQEYAPSEEDRAFYRDLVALTRHDHRLCGYGAADPQHSRTIEVTKPAGEGETAETMQRTLTAYRDEPGSLFAASYVANRLRALGVKYVLEQHVPVVQPVFYQCELTVVRPDGTQETFDRDDGFYPMRPNILHAPVTPEYGLLSEQEAEDGRRGLDVLYAGDGDAEDYPPALAEGKIVVVEYDCDKKWLHAFAFGARAVIFIGPEDQPAGQVLNPFHHVNVPAILPRYYVTPALAKRLNLREPAGRMNVRAACEWRQLRGCNVIGFLPGTDPVFGEDKDSKPEAVILAAPLDTYAEVPELARGARDAANCAAVLRAAAYFQTNRPRRDVLVCFFDGQAQNHLGARAFFGGVLRGLSTIQQAAPLERRYRLYEEEREFRRAVRKIAQERLAFLRDLKLTEGQERPLFPQELKSQANYDAALRVLKAQARALSGRVLDELQPLRVRKKQIGREISLAREVIERHESGKERVPAKRLAEARHILARLEPMLAEGPDSIPAKIEELSARDMDWNCVERDLFKNRVTGATLEDMRRLFARARDASTRRLEEIDQALRELDQAIRLRNGFGPARRKIVLSLAMNLGDARQAWSFIHGEDSVPLGDDKPGEYSTVFGAIESVHEALGEARAAHFDPRPVSGRYDPRLFGPGRRPYADSGGIARLFSIRNLSVMTVLDRLGRQGHPTDTRAALDAPTFLAQAREVPPFLAALLDRAALGTKFGIRTAAQFQEAVYWKEDTFRGPSVKRAGGGTAMADRPLVRGTVAIIPPAKAGPWARGQLETVPAGFVFPVRTQTNVYGLFEVQALAANDFASIVVFAANFDQPKLGAEDAGARSRGLVDAVTTMKQIKVLQADLRQADIEVFKTRPVTLVGYGYDRGAVGTTAMRAAATTPFREEQYLLAEFGNVLTLYAPYDARGWKVFNKRGAVVLNNTEKRYQGRGLRLGDRFAHPFTPWRSAWDLHVLNEARTQRQRENRISEESLEDIHGTARTWLMDARKLREALEGPSAAAGDHTDTAEAGPATTAGARAPEPAAAAQPPARGPEAEPDRPKTLSALLGLITAALHLDQRAYPPTVGVMKDMVTAVVLLLLLAMPFAYALERLLVGTPHIYRQIGWFTGFFLITFAVLFLVNPAFQIAATPIVIFLAFAIILLSSLVIFIMTRKLQTEVKKVQGLATTVHSADVSRLSTMMAAVNMGISTMRRRPLRTLLTAITVVLLTFTILTFASFGTQWGNRRTFVGTMPDPTPRIFVRHQLWSPVPEGTYHSLRDHLAHAREPATVVPRYWIAPTAQETQNATKQGVTLEWLVGSADVQHVQKMGAVMGIDPRDLQRQEELARMLDGRTDLLAPGPDGTGGDGIFLTHAVAERIGLADAEPGTAQVLLAGQRMTYAGRIREAMAGHNAIEGSPIRPVNYEESGGGNVETIVQQTQSESLQEVPPVESAQFVHYNLDSVAVIGAEMARKLGGRIRGLTIYPAEPADVQEVGQQVARISGLPTFVGDRAGVYRLLFTSLATARGVSGLLVPVLLGGLIIFATMLGSVSDRESEIYTFSSLGLAPPHVASLFFAEASMYAVVGGMGGYLLGQVVARLLAWMSAAWGISVPTMNYSSTNAIVTILIVMGTVMISTIYPALKASRSANPGIQRAWKVPPPEGNLYDVMFPFTVSAYDITGVASFLKEHFDNFTDASLGTFATTQSEVFRQQQGDMLGFRATVALAPFDLGVTQRFALLSKPSEIEGIDEVQILIYRLSGARGDWRRGNRVFINELRKQLLIWRSLTQEVMEQYRERTLEVWDQLPRLQVDRDTIGGTA